MKRKLLIANILAMAATVFFCGVSLAGLCSDLGKPKGCVTAADLRNLSVGAAKIRVEAINTDKIKNFNVKTRDLADGAVTGNKLAAGLEARIVALENKLQYVTVVEGEINGMAGPHVIITGANVHIRNGLNATDAMVNGLGNLIVGYNELRGDVTDDRTGSHNLAVGTENNYSSYGGMVVGQTNEISAEYASVSGGTNNLASGVASSVSGGWANTASAPNASVSGGRSNTASGEEASVTGGRLNTASGLGATVLGGGGQLPNGAPRPNVASGDWSTVSGGRWNTASGLGSSVTGGLRNEASGVRSSVTGGFRNLASSTESTVSGGAQRSVDGIFDWRAGGLFEDQ